MQVNSPSGISTDQIFQIIAAGADDPQLLLRINGGVRWIGSNLPLTAQISAGQ
jgi:hypothetical protein